MIDEINTSPDFAGVYLALLNASVTSLIANLSLVEILSSEAFNKITFDALPDDKTVISN